MKISGITELKRELQQLEPGVLAELCLSLAKYKKENKEYLGYLLFEAHNKTDFVNSIKTQVDALFAAIDTSNNLYYVKKSLRKILRQIVKYCRYLDDKALSAELHIYFCIQLKNSGIPFRKSQLLINLYEQELKKIDAFINALHPDLRSDYSSERESIQLHN